jgi:hypothetical protein
MHQLIANHIELGRKYCQRPSHFFDAVDISDVPGTSGINARPPTLASAESVNVVGTASGNVAATALDDDLVRRVDDDNATFVRGDATENAAGLAC